MQTTRKNRLTSIFIAIASLWACSNIYADVYTTKNINLIYNPNIEKKRIYTYPGREKITLTLSTLAVSKIHDANNELDNDLIMLEMWCTNRASGERHLYFIDTYNNIPPLACEEGQGVKIKIYNDGANLNNAEQLNSYFYRGILVISSKSKHEDEPPRSPLGTSFSTSQHNRRHSCPALQIPHLQIPASITKALSRQSK